MDREPQGAVSRSSRHFACTRCGACCVRSPEVELSEAAALADVFVFRLMARLYPAGGNDRLGQFAIRIAGARPTFIRLSALTVDPGTGRCSALDGPLCSVHERRPLSCRTVPLHYSRSEGSLVDVYDGFLAMPGHDCDSSPDAPPLLVDARLVEPVIADARQAAVARSAGDRPWKRAIIAAMKGGGRAGLPTLDEVRDNATAGALTTSMRIAWDIAVEDGLMTAAERTTAIRQQVGAIDRLLDGTLSADSRQTLCEMRTEYGLALRNLPAA